MSRAPVPEGTRAEGAGIGERPAAPAETPQARLVQREIGDLVRAHEQRRRQLPRAIATGLIAGLVAVVFRQCLEHADLAREMLDGMAREHGGWKIALPILFGALGAGTAVAVVRRFAPEASGSGIPHIKAVLDHVRGLAWQRVLPVKFLGGLAAIGGGLALGREGPTVQMGGAIGQMVGTWFPCTARERRTLIAAGAGAGLSAAFNAPLAGVVFVLEEVQRDFGAHVFAATIAASVTADVVTRLLLGQLPVFHVPAHAIPPLESLPIGLAVGVLAGLLGVAFNRALVATLDLFDRLPPWPRWIPAAAVGAAIGAVGIFLPDALAGGRRLLGSMLVGDLGVPALVGVFALRFALTMTSYGCGAPGGIFAPLLVLGAAVGLATGEIAHSYVGRPIIDPASFAVVGMAAYFAAIVRAPLTGVVLMVEMTGEYALVLPLVLASSVAYGIAEYLRNPPIYHSLLERDLRRFERTEPHPQPLLVELTVAPGAPFDGSRVRDLSLPAGCVIVSVDRGAKKLVPTAESIVTSGDRLSLVISPDAPEALSFLRLGAGA